MLISMCYYCYIARESVKISKVKLELCMRMVHSIITHSSISCSMLSDTRHCCITVIRYMHMYICVYVCMYVCMYVCIYMIYGCQFDMPDMRRIMFQETYLMLILYYTDPSGLINRFTITFN